LGTVPISFPGVSFVRNAPGKKRPGNRAGAVSVCRYGHLAREASTSIEWAAEATFDRPIHVITSAGATAYKFL
jgi:hypothetical protein